MAESVARRLSVIEPLGKIPVAADKIVISDLRGGALRDWVREAGARAVKGSAEGAVEMVARWVNGLRDGERWRTAYASWDAVLDDLGIDPDQIDFLFQNRSLLRDKLATFGVDGETCDAVEVAVERRVLMTHAEAGAKGGRGRKAPSNSKEVYGETRAYTLARLERDRPDLAERVIAGDLSANAAAIEAGFRRPPDSLAQLRAAWKRATPEQRQAFKDWIAT
jgi:hypothetical protein